MTRTVDRLQWTSPKDFCIDGVSFHAAAFGSVFMSTPDHFFLMKPRDMIERYLEVLDDLRPRRVLELGVFAGGSTALLGLTQDLQRLTAIEKSVSPVEALADFLRARSLEDVIRVHYGADQGDLPRLAGICNEDFGPGTELDLVIDDASHELGLTRGTFELIFPRLRPGGAYIIEDWSWGHFPFARKIERPTLARLVVEILLTIPFTQGLVEDVSVNRYFTVVRRGGRNVGAEPISLDRSMSRRGRRLLEGTDG